MMMMMMMRAPRSLPSWRLRGAALAHSGARGRSHGGAGRRKSATRDGESIPQPSGEFLYGIHSVTQALASRHRRVHALYVRDGEATTDAGALEQIRRLAGELQVPVRPVSKWMLNHVTEDKPHQGVVLDVDALKLPTFEPMDAADPSLASQSTSRPVILALDELHDTQNLGAILRSAHFLGCSAILLSERNSAPVSPANKLQRVKNLHQALAISRENGWRIVGACSGPNSITSNQLSSSTSRQPTILVMGNEHRGMRKGIRQCCDDIVTIPGHATESDTRVDSLNVSVAAAILLYELLHH
ncbi:hypothetical protein P43SY_001641 [Pythium insidiosum]|uniref:rRNA methyltransferase 1, mitochondrial n=1 Tax=Pythium insidiosum TaxID=114742 RepID=A0AAD5M4V9_PYTIN|nr:hypothetical protein P43SY_001641 [Pythium insidiosum]